MAKDDDFAADVHGLTAAKTLNKYVKQLYRKAKREKQKRDAATDRKIADQIDVIVYNLIRSDNSERRSVLDQIRETAMADSILDTLTETAVDQLRCIQCEDSMRGLIAILVEIGPRILRVVSRSWQSAPSVTQAFGVVFAIGLLIEKMDPGELQCALGQLKRASDWLGTADDRMRQAVNRVEFQLLQALQSSPAGR